MYRLSVKQQGFKEMFARMKAEENGKLLQLEFRRELKALMEPAVQEVKAGVLEYQGAGLNRRGASLTQVISGKVKVGVNASGRLTGVRIYISKVGMPRNFANAPRDLNAKSWQVRGRMQVGPVGFFDKPTKKRAREARKVIEAAMDRMAKRMAG